MNEPTKLKLSKPITAHGEKCFELTFREPTGSDIIECGYPFTTEISGASPIRHINMRIIGLYISTLAEIPMVNVGQLSTIDMMRAMGIVIGFFSDSGASQSSSSSIISTSPPLGETQPTHSA